MITTFTIKVEGLEGAELTGKTEINLKEGEVGTLPLNVKTIPWELKNLARILSLLSPATMDLKHQKKAAL